MLEPMIVRGILYFVDGLFWLLTTMFIVTMFYGYPVKTSKNRNVLLGSVATIYAVGNLILYYIAQKNHQDVGITNGLIVLFGIIYWYRQMIGVGPIKRILVILFATEFSVCIMEVFSCMVTLFKLPSMLLFPYFFLLPIAQLLLSILFIYGISWLSFRKRREPMRFLLIIATQILCMFVDMLMSFLDVDNYSEVQTIMNYRLVFPRQIQEEAMTVTLLVIVFIFIILFILVVIRESEADYFNKKSTIHEYYLETQKTHYESLMESNREIRKIKHDMKNHIYCLQSLYQNEKYAEMGTYLEDLGEHLEQADHNVHVGNEIADAILSEKKKLAQEKGISMTVEGDMYGMEMSALDICTIFANMLDNAIEAVEQLEVAKQRIHLSIRKSNHYLLICETNPTKQLLKIQDNMLPTTKKNRERHGFGMINIKETIAKYDGEVHLQANVSEDGTSQFCIEIMIPM